MDNTMTWDEAVELFKLECQVLGRRPRTIQLHRENLEATYSELMAQGSPTLPGSVSPEDLRLIVRAMLNRGLKARTINIRLQTLWSFFGFLRNRGLVPTDPTHGLKRLVEDRALPRTLASHEQVAVLLGQPNRGTFTGIRDFAAILLQVDTGVRLGELLKLRLSDVDLGSRVVSIRPEANKVHTGRQIPITFQTSDVLTEYLRARGVLATDRLFVSRRGAPLAVNTYQKALARYGQRAGLGPLSPHVLRHTFARLYLTNGGEGLVLRRLLGHRDSSMTDWYVQLWSSDLRAMHDEFSPVLRVMIPGAPGPGALRGRTFKSRSGERRRRSA